MKAAISKNIPKLKLDKVERDDSISGTYMPTQEEVLFNHGGEQYRLRMEFPKIVFFVPGVAYEQVLRLSRGMVKEAVEKVFKGLGSYVDHCSFEKCHP